MPTIEAIAPPTRQASRSGLCGAFGQETIAIRTMLIVEMR